MGCHFLLQGIFLTQGSNLGYQGNPYILIINYQLVKNSPTMQETWAWSLCWEDPLEKGKATHSSILGLPLWLSWRRICLQCRRPRFDPCVGEIPWRRERLYTPVFWLGDFHIYPPHLILFPIHISSLRVMGSFLNCNIKLLSLLLPDLILLKLCT